MKKPRLIAEIGGNHQGSFERALELVNLALSSDADIIKMQVYSGEGLVNPSVDRERFDHFKKFQLSLDQHFLIAQQVKAYGKSYLASVWDIPSLKLLSPHMDFYKIGSGDMTNYQMISYMSKNPKPLIISTGLSEFREVEDVVNFIRNENDYYNEPENLIVLQCSSMYPIENSDANLNVMKTYRGKFECQVGYSDHTIGNEALFIAGLAGADFLEFHFTDDKTNLTFRDHCVSLEKHDVDNLSVRLNEAALLLGSFEKNVLNIELENGHVQSFRRAVYLNRDIDGSTVIKESDLVCLRPNKGIDARRYKELVGAKSKRALKAFEILSLDDFEF